MKPFVFLNIFPARYGNQFSVIVQAQGRQGRHRSREGPGKTPVLSEKDATRLLNLVPLRFFAERERADKGSMSALSALSLNDN